VWCELCNEKYGTNLEQSDITDWAAWKIAGITRDQFFRLLDDCWSDWERIPPVEKGIGRKVSRVSSFGAIDIVTGRSRRTISAAKRWLGHHSIPYRRFVGVESMKSKIHLNYDVFVDDSPMIPDSMRLGDARHAIVYARPWNRSVKQTKRTFRVSTWNRIPGILRGFGFG
jgi:uncharacterized HAD superfamily protein